MIAAATADPRKEPDPHDAGSTSPSPVLVDAVHAASDAGHLHTLPGDAPSPAGSSPAIRPDSPTLAVDHKLRQLDLNAATTAASGPNSGTWALVTTDECEPLPATTADQFAAAADQFARASDDAMPVSAEGERADRHTTASLSPSPDGTKPHAVAADQDLVDRARAEVADSELSVPPQSVDAAPVEVDLAQAPLSAEVAEASPEPANSLAAAVPVDVPDQDSTSLVLLPSTLFLPLVATSAIEIKAAAPRSPDTPTNKSPPTKPASPPKPAAAATPVRASAPAFVPDQVKSYATMRRKTMAPTPLRNQILSDEVDDEHEHTETEQTESVVAEVRLQPAATTVAPGLSAHTTLAGKIAALESAVASTQDPTIAPLLSAWLADLRSLRSTTDTAHARAVSAETQCRQLAAQATAAESRVAQLQGAMGAQVGTVTHLRGELDRALHRAADLEQHLLAARNDAVVRDAMAAQLAHRLAAAQNDVEVVRGDARNLRARLNETDERVRAARGECDAWVNRARQLERAAVQATVQANQATAALAQVQQQAQEQIRAAQQQSQQGQQGQQDMAERDRQWQTEVQRIRAQFDRIIEQKELEAANAMCNVCRQTLGAARY
ncbi:hypothetical protein AMAG_10775 [Allomyces macrogynus ATCC 38327]|uniref:Uncharacterized protein n=1 Tax=Allomyces macrogynus (strain ATCC 38327) TaxID=578462 RepID=A0A0L0SRX3_ALLM3|nr:hypothetical protein AMAG_10775 [Allomyces macrogynus ATCC 38327]|eukprot:KNE65120.1 hypothetical protein AMAG_10775 [Allomyces macrogynus ATCC 38327]